MDKQQFKPFTIGDRVISEADGPGTVTEIYGEYYVYPVFVQMDLGYNCYTKTGQFFSWETNSDFDIRHMTAEEMEQYPKPE